MYASLGSQSVSLPLVFNTLSQKIVFLLLCRTFCLRPFISVHLWSVFSNACIFFRPPPTVFPISFFYLIGSRETPIPCRGTSIFCLRRFYSFGKLSNLRRQKVIYFVIILFSFSTTFSLYLHMQTFLKCLRRSLIAFLQLFGSAEETLKERQPLRYQRNELILRQLHSLLERFEKPNKKHEKSLRKG